LTRRLYAHLIAATVLNCLVIIAALAVDSVAPWVAIVLLASALGVAGHAAHVQRAGAQPDSDERGPEADLVTTRSVRRLR
jgi:hypothetical protein